MYQTYSVLQSIWMEWWVIGIVCGCSAHLIFCAWSLLVCLGLHRLPRCGCACLVSSSSVISSPVSPSLSIVILFDISVADTEKDPMGLKRIKNVIRAVDGLNLTVPHNQIFCLLGPNGAGKIRVLPYPPCHTVLA